MHNLNMGTEENEKDRLRSGPLLTTDARKRSFLFWKKKKGRSLKVRKATMKGIWRLKGRKKEKVLLRSSPKKKGGKEGISLNILTI